MLKIIATYCISLLVFLLVDFTWLLGIAREFYKLRFGNLMSPTPNLVAAAAFYLFYAGGLMFFAIQPALRGHSWRTALLNGAILGFIAYGTYDLTNLATLRNWSLSLTLVDLVWGTVLSAVVATLTYTLASLYA